MQNFAAHILTNTRKYDHISPVLHELGWLTIEELLRLHDVTMMCKCLNGLMPGYLTSKLVKHSETHLCKTRQREQLSFLFSFWCQTSATQRALSNRAPKSWNSLYSENRKSTSIGIFKKNTRLEFAKTCK